MTKMPQKWRQQPWKLLKWQKYRWNLKNKQNTLETSKNDQNTPKQIQNTLDFQNFGGILISFKLHYSS